MYLGNGIGRYMTFSLGGSDAGIHSGSGVGPPAGPGVSSLHSQESQK